MNTKETNKLPITEAEFKAVLREKANVLFVDFQKEINELMAEIAKIKNQGEFYVGEMYFNFAQKVVIPKKQIEKISYTKFTENYLKGRKLFKKIPLELPTSEQLCAISKFLSRLPDISDAFVCKPSGVDVWKRNAFKLSTQSFTMPGRSNVTVLPIANLNYSNSNELFVNYLMPYELCPNHLSEKGKRTFLEMTCLYKLGKDMFKIKSDKVVLCGGEMFVEEFLQNPDSEKLSKLKRVTEILKKYYESKTIVGKEMYSREDLLNCEKVRADIEPYEARLLTDPNRGHWDLWMEEGYEGYTVEVEDEMVARNPLCDINENGVIAIDFGTKSTIVVYQSNIEHSLPMGIGDGNLKKEPSPKRYENPTVMHFVNLERFLEEYNAAEGRPKTKWEDLTISHTALDQFSNSKSEEYYEYMHQLKQWAGMREKQFRVRSHNSEDSYVLPSFMDLKDDDWNPIEIYAYYIGLYINNMRKGHGIFLDYYLSFPVTYEQKIREKIVKSFEKGLKKSLPAVIVNNEEVMKNFKVNGDISEPAAYAVCALQEYGFEPEGDEEVFYGIFDFGGGTTDFDFGIWMESKKRRYDYSIENFGAGGDEYLGGENILEMLAFEVFKANQEVMRDGGFPFALTPKCTEFLGSDALLSDSQEAEKNMHNLMEKIRPYWEKPKKKWSYNDNELIDKIEFIVNLFNKEGMVSANERLQFSLSKLNELIEKRISEGINNFFSALMLSYQNNRVKKPTVLNILLAGNSCKSPVVKELFEKKIAEYEAELKAKFPLKENDGHFFELFPPLGTEEAFKKMEERGIEFSPDDFEKPTGKTGVAFGLIQCRTGGNIERITNVGFDEEIPFQYFIGWRRKKKFEIFKDDSKSVKYKGKPDYGVWYKFIEADEDVFDLYYTSLPECIEGNLPVESNAAVKRLRCNVDTVDENAFVYIRAIDPHTLEYAVSKSDDVDNSKIGAIVRKEL